VRSDKVTRANVQDSQALADVLDLDNDDPQVWADSAYRSEQTEANLAVAEYASHIYEKEQANCPLDAAALARNRTRSKIRARVERVFGYQECSLGGKLVRTIGLARTEVKIGLMNLTYNFKRYLVLIRPGIGAPSVACRGDRAFKKAALSPSKPPPQYP
jgi:transposase, IS5 family